MWKDLSMQQRADLMDIYLSHGISSLDEMRNHYDSRNQFAEGGNLFSGEDTSTQQMNNGLNLYRNTNKDGDVWYTYQETPDSEEILLTPTNKRFSDDPTNWDYKDASGREYTPRMAKPAVPQAELRPYEKDWYHKITEALGYDWLVNKSNKYYNSPILGAPARWAASWDNNTNPIKALWNSPFAYSNIYSLAAKAADDVLLNPNGLQKTIDLYNSSNGSHADRYAWQSSLLGDVFNASMMLPAASKAAKSMYNGATRAVENYGYPFGRPQVPEGYITVKPQVRTRVGDVEIDNPNLLYHLDRGDSAGAFSNQGAYVEDGKLLPGIAKEGEIPYSWWNLGRPYATGVNGQPMTRLMTTTKDTPGMLHVRSQNYSIGQWNGKRGLVTNAEYVNPEGVNVSESTYTLDPNYGWRRLFAEDASTAKWADAVKTPQITAENAASITPEQWTAAQDAAIARGDMAEAQRLRDLHFNTKSSGSDASKILYNHSTDSEPFYSFDLDRPTNHAGSARNGKGVYTEPLINLSEEPDMAVWGRNFQGDWGSNNLKLRINFENPEIPVVDNPISTHPEGYVGRVEAFVRDPRKIKLDDAVTYDPVTGRRIPLGERDNFNIKDIRYGLLPFGIGLTGYGLWQENE